MTLSELIAHLEEVQERTEGDPEVRIAHQPQWPFEYSVGAVVDVDLAQDEMVECREALDELDPKHDARTIAEVHQRLGELTEQAGCVVYLGEGTQLGYLPSAAMVALSW